MRFLLINNVIYIGIDTSTYKWHEIDVKNYNNNYYIAIVAIFYLSGTSTTSVTNSWLTKSDNYQELCLKAGVEAPSTLSGLVADSTKLTAILSNEEAVEYMVKQCTGDFMVNAVSSQAFMTAFNSSEYKTKIEENLHWSKFLNMM